MRKCGVIFAAVVGLLFLLAVGCGAAQTQFYYDGAWHDYNGNIFQLKINGGLVKTEVPPVVFNDRSVVPARAVFEELGASVNWEAEQQLVTVTMDTTVVAMQIDNTTAYINGAGKQMEIPPKIINGSTMIPARFVSEELGMQVDFDGETDVIEIIKEPIVRDKYTVRDITTQLADGVFHIHIVGDKTGAAFSDFTLDNPSRIVLDITGAQLQTAQTLLAIGQENISQVRLGERESGVRVVIDVTQNAGYSVWQEGTDLYIDVTVVTPPAGESVLDRVSLSNENGADVVSVGLKADNPRLSAGKIAIAVYGDRLTQEREERAVNGTLAVKLFYEPQSQNNGTVYLQLKEGVTPSMRYNNQGDALTLTLQPQRTPQQSAQPGERFVVIDAGHGGSDSGTLGKDADGNVVLDGAGRIWAVEKEINLNVARRVRDILQDNGVKVVMTRDSDVLVDLYHIPEIANETGAPLFVSIHSNSVEGAPSANGVEVWGFVNGGSARSGMTSKRLSELIVNHFVAATGAKNRGVKDGKNLVVVRLTDMPAALVELGFLTNDNERGNLMDDGYRQKCAQGIAAGILAAFDEMGY